MNVILSFSFNVQKYFIYSYKWRYLRIRQKDTSTYTQMEEMVRKAATAKTAPEDLMITIRYNKGNFNYLRNKLLFFL